jgi:hypothetical protein
MESKLPWKFSHTFFLFGSRFFCFSIRKIPFQMNLLLRAICVTEEVHTFSCHLVVHMMSIPFSQVINSSSARTIDAMLLGTIPIDLEGEAQADQGAVTAITTTTAVVHATLEVEHRREVAAVGDIIQLVVLHTTIITHTIHITRIEVPLVTLAPDPDLTLALRTDMLTFPLPQYSSPPRRRTGMQYRAEYAQE